MAPQKLRPFLKNTTKTIIKGMLGFKRAFLLFFSVFFISTFALIIAQFLPTVTFALADSRVTPWGIITSIFVHTSFEHFALNMIGLFAYTILFAFANSAFKQEINKKVDAYFVVSTLICAIASNIIWLILVPDPSAGASGLVYATEVVYLGSLS